MSVCSRESTFIAAPTSTANAIRNTRNAPARKVSSTLVTAWAVARTDGGARDSQTASRPEPVAIAVPPTTAVSTSDQPSVRPWDGAVSGLPASTSVRTAITR